MTNQPHDGQSQRHDLSVDDLVLDTQHRHHKRHRVDSDVTENGSPAVILEPSHRHHSSSSHHHSSARHGHHHHSKKKKHPVRTALLIAAMCLLGIIVVAVSTIAVLQARGRAALLTATEDVNINVPADALADAALTVEDNGRTVTYNGESYAFNENRTNILCIGVDKTEMGLVGDIVGTGGQADTLVVLSVDTTTGQVDTLAIPRDTITDIDLYTADGAFYGVENTQICLAYAYGDGRETSCENVVRSASRVLYGIPINTYLAIDLDCISVLNDAIGGVEVTLLTDFRRDSGAWCSAGQTITLWGDEAERYVRSRDITQLDSNLDRMQRQQQYITNFFNQAITATKSDLQVPLDLYGAVKGDCVTNLSPSKITYLATTLVQHDSALTFAQVPGEVIKSDEDGYAEFIVDNKALYEQVLDIFYTKV